MKIFRALAGVLVLVSVVGRGAGQEAASPAGGLSVGGFGSIQEALDANPGKMIYVPAGDYEITESIRIHADNSGLWGPGRIIQANPEVPIV
ncbi:MAG: hypothetical protein HQ582_08445, partial [Planctomycetes bacterium]|nr:hypothetical protein [Planctomycetota bacterium]